MITNEPAYYGGYLYPILVCILPVFVLNRKEEMSRRFGSN
jgi:hypothetical protein